jgi:hypothetical protein
MLLIADCEFADSLFLHFVLEGALLKQLVMGIRGRNNRKEADGAQCDRLVVVVVLVRIFGG